MKLRLVGLVFGISWRRETAQISANISVRWEPDGISAHHSTPPLHEDADDGPSIFKSCYGTLLSETWTEGPGPTHVAAVLPAATASSSESPEPTTAGEPNVL